MSKIEMTQTAKIKRIPLLIAVTATAMVVVQLEQSNAANPATMPTTLPVMLPTTMPGMMPTTAPALPMVWPTTLPSIVAAPVAIAMPDPRFAGWSKFKVGSSVTLAGDMTVQGVNARMTIVQTLTQVTATDVKVENKIGVLVFGSNNDSPPQVETIAATATVMAGKELALKDVAINGKTYSCMALDMVDNPGQPNEVKRVVYLTDAVPGGVVEMDVTDAGGKTVSLKMTGSDVK